MSVTVDDEHLADIDSVAAALRVHGMEVVQVLGELGVITGSVPDGQRQAVGAVEGVASVDEQVEFRLPPPDSPLQ